nr:ATPase, T2SS/T4P/T4SS family [uncultured Methanoregula sp.]
MGKDDDDSLDGVNSFMKKIGRAKKTQSAPVNPPESLSPDNPEPTGDFSLLLKKMQPAIPSDQTPSGIPEYLPPDRSAGDSAMSLDDLLEDDAEEIPLATPPQPKGFPEQIDTTASTPLETSPGPELESSIPTPSGAPLAKPAHGNVTPPPVASDPMDVPAARAGASLPEPDVSEEDEKIITVDQISNISGLILPKGTTFSIDELRLHGNISSYAGFGTGTLPTEIDELWKKNFSSAGFKDLDIGQDLLDAESKTSKELKKFSIGSLFKAIRQDQEEYDPAKHGPLVDLTFPPLSNIEEMELYPVNEPYAYIRVTYDHSTHEYTYHVLEPALTDPEKELLKELKERLFETLDINTKDISKDEAKTKLRTATVDIIHDYGIRLSPLQREKIHYNMYKDFLGDGLIDAIMHDKYIEDISCDGVHTPIFAFHSSYESMKTTLLYHTAEDLDSFVTKLAQRAGKYISIAEPILDATMQDGSRIQMTLGTEVTAHGSTFTIRKFKDEPITPTDLIEWHTFSPLAIAYIWLAVENGKSAIFAGGTASGKTTALNAISLFIPPMAKVVSLEDTREVKLPHPNWIPSVTRDSFDTAGRGEINMYELLRAAMRQRPEYIIVGEVRGKECQTLFQAMSTGHVTYSTTHADSVASVVHRIENPPMDVPRNMLSALDFICVQVQARVGGKRIRRNKQIVEILDIDPRTNELITNEVFKWRSATDEHTYSGKSYLLEEIMEAKGWSESRMREELKRRQEVLEWMRTKKIRHYKDVAKILISYHRDPEAVIENVRKDLYE